MPSSPHRLAAAAVAATAVLGLVTIGTGEALAAPASALVAAGPDTGSEAASKPLPAPPRPTQQPVHTTRAVPRSSLATSNSPSSGQRSAAAASAAVPLATTTPTTPTALVLYDTTGTWGWLGELYAEQNANLAGHFGTYKAEPISKYTAGQLASYTAVIYTGSTYDEPIPAAFLSDVLATTKPVLWMGDNIWQLTAADPTFTADYGWNWTGFDTSAVNSVTYKGQSLARDGVNNQGGILNLTVSDASRATVLANSVRANGTTFPWATRAKNLTYVGEVPYSYEGMSDRYLIASDLMFDALAPGTTARHRALVRIEDVNPSDDPNDLRKVADTLSGLGVPFTFGVVPVYTDPKGYYNNGVAKTVTLAQAPQVVSAIKYMLSKGGTMIDHGYTHQFGSANNPYDGVTADDCEFYTCTIDPATNAVLFTGPVAGDSATYAQSRVTNAQSAFRAAGLTPPTVWEFPHYVASAVDYATIGTTYKTRYERDLLFGGLLSGGAANYAHTSGQFFPYPVTDIYGTKVIPENIGNDEPVAVNQNAARHPADIIASAKANLVVRDGFASFFFHPYLMSDTAHGTTNDLATIVTGIKALGYTFVASTSV